MPIHSAATRLKKTSKHVNPEDEHSKEHASAKLMLYQLKIKLLRITPPVWRRVLVPSNFTLHDLHLVIQASMGWTNSHLYAFRRGDTYFIIPDTEFADDYEDSRKVRISRMLIAGKQPSIRYEYDFGDNWEHEVLLERIVPMEKGVRYPACTKGKMACPPEDCGGVWGYHDMLQIIRNPKHPEYEETIEWLGDDIDPKDFDLELANERVRRYEKMDMTLY
jgi:hypothetical protein